MSKPVNVFDVPNRLRACTDGGGKTREEAVRDAATQLKEVSASANEGIRIAIATIEQLASRSAELTSDELAEVLAQTERLLSIADAFGHKRLTTVAHSLGDLASSFMVSGRAPSAPIGVHVRAARLVATARAASPEMVDHVLAELARVRDYFLGPARQAPGK